MEVLPIRSLVPSIARVQAHLTESKGHLQLLLGPDNTAIGDLIFDVPASSVGNAVNVTIALDVEGLTLEVTTSESEGKEGSSLAKILIPLSA